jgi:opacity protein-like surface antigen
MKTYWERRMKKIIFCTTVCLIFAVPAISFGASGPYGSVNAGVTILPDSDLDVTISGLGSVSEELSYDSGFTIGGAVGYKIENFRYEGEISYQKNDLDSISALGISLPVDGDISFLTFLVNGYFDFGSGGPLTPYVTAGIGYSNFEIGDGGDSEDDNLFTYQLGVGVGFTINENVTLDLRYRYLGFEDYEYSDATGRISAEISSHNITAGLRFAF